MHKKMRYILFIGLLMLGLMARTENVNADEDGELVIVVDPGHGGSQNGAEYDGVMEKDINMVVSKVLVEELEKYDGVKVYLTHDSAEDTMSIQKRAEFANEVDADYFFCIHFNASANHNFYGAEAWITSYGRYYSEMYAFSEIVLNEFSNIGVFNRGIKTKLETDGTDYYGVLRRCAEFDIPAVIIEHAHMDNARDDSFLDEEDDLVKFGRLDAMAIAKFLKLKSEELGVDYSAFEYELPAEPEQKIQNDVTAPVCNVSVAEIDDTKQTVTFQIEASDEEYPILYYGYSYDGGTSFSNLMIWEKDKEFINVTFSYDECMLKQLVFRVYNGFNLAGDSQNLTVSDEIQKFREEHMTVLEKTVEGDLSEYSIQKQSGGEIYLIIAIVSILASVVVAIALTVNLKKNN